MAWVYTECHNSGRARTVPGRPSCAGNAAAAPSRFKGCRASCLGGWCLKGSGGVYIACVTCTACIGCMAGVLQGFQLVRARCSRLLLPLLIVDCKIGLGGSLPHSRPGRCSLHKALALPWHATFHHQAFMGHWHDAPYWAQDGPCIAGLK